jgi:hypothetical protein
LKRLVIGIFSAFFVLLGVSVYIAERTYDGTVEENYYQRSLDYFHGGDRGAARAASMPFLAFSEGQKVLFDIAPKPVKTMRELTFSVEVPGYGGAGSPWIDLGMAGMRMAPNRVDLVKEGDGRYLGKWVLVRCPSGMRTWTATVHLPGKGKALFTFHVAD